MSDEEVDFLLLPESRVLVECLACRERFCQKSGAQIGRSNGNLLPSVVFLRNTFDSLGSSFPHSCHPSAFIVRLLCQAIIRLDFPIELDLERHGRYKQLHMHKYVSSPPPRFLLFHSRILLQRGIYLVKLFSLGLWWDLLIGSPLESPAYRASASHFPN
jgi:hypothetical protein